MLTRYKDGRQLKLNVMAIWNARMKHWKLLAEWPCRIKAKQNERDETALC